MAGVDERSDPADPAGRDDDLVAACRAGDERAWDELIDAYAPYIYSVARRAYGLTAAAADEVFQDACIRMYFGLSGYSGRSGFRPWLRAVVVSACREHVRQTGRTASRTTEEDPVDEPVEQIEDLDAALDLRAAVATLGEPCRSTIALHFFEDLTQSDVAERLGVPPGTIAARLSRCIQRLRAVVEAQEPRAQENPRSEASGL